MTEILNVNDTFKDWDAVETAVNMFAKSIVLLLLNFFNNNHNHQCDPVSIELASKNLRFSQSILDKIEHYTQKVHDESNAATIFLYLLKQHEEDPNYIVIPRLEGPSNKLTVFSG
ncbi:unnamed protein product [Rhizophagus irregularis]|nr:unnamed protein product [Rhizophagus irregularis]